MSKNFKNQFELNLDNVSYTSGEGDNNFSFNVMCVDHLSSYSEELKDQALKAGKGEWSDVYVFDRKFSSYNPGTQMLLETFQEQGMEWEGIEEYADSVEYMEELKSVEEAKRFIYGMGTDYIDEMELDRDWQDIMFPRAEKSPYLKVENE